MTTELKTAQAALSSAITDHNRMDEKVREYNGLVAEARKIIDLFVTERESSERELVRGKSTPEAVAKIDKKLKEAEEKFESYQRLLAFSKEENIKLTLAVTTARQALANARYKFCVGEKDRLAAELNSNQSFRKLLVSAYAANASNNLGYTADWKLFVGQIIAEPSAAEIEAAKAAFIKEHGLSD